ncbi:MAG TPA: dTDP-4-dehydrorhamnose 3,5-epimerase [Bacteroidia bacterium]|nr:dTDP-4-dehydrorhamnose 3,5-epimerase [Bacteroidia bacterium]
MKIIKTALNGICIIQADVFSDERGYFLESYQKEKLKNLGIEAEFYQDNFSLSAKNVLRGLHFQNPPFDQGKLIKVICGAVLDVVVDIRKSSPTYQKNFTIVLNAEDHLMMWIPPGFAHGFVSLKENTLFYYKCSKPYHKDSEAGIIYNDPVLNINWSVNQPVLSEKDKILPNFSNATILF